MAVAVRSGGIKGKKKKKDQRIKKVLAMGTEFSAQRKAKSRST
jgi:hypothetical protein